ncbi:MAG: pilus assembly protein [Nitrosomonas sp.]|nr:pilus assembly protein [Nitrosomonas sp.]
MNRKTMRGAVAVEMALLLIPLIIMAFGVAEFGRAIYQYNTLTKVVRDSVRVVSQHDPSDLINYPLFEAEAKCLAVHGTIDCSGPALLPGLTTGMVQIASAPDAGTGINMVTVTISGYVFNFVFNPLVFFGNTATNIPFGDVHSTMRQL